MAYTNQAAWDALTAKGAIPMMVTRTFIFDGVRYDQGDPFVCDSAIKMRQLYEQRMIQPKVPVAEAMQRAAAQPEPVAQEHPAREAQPERHSGRFHKKHHDEG